MDSFDQEKLDRAKKKVKDIKGFYTHLAVYLLVNLFLLIAQLGLFSGHFKIGMPEWSYFTTPFFWGIGLFFHGVHVFKDQVPFLKNWEQRKIREYMEKEEQQYKDTFKNR